MTKCRIGWKSVRTGATGYGSGIFTEEEAANIIHGFERADEFELYGLTHWAEKIPTPAPPSTES